MTMQRRLAKNIKQIVLLQVARKTHETDNNNELQRVKGGKREERVNITDVRKAISQRGAN